MIPVVGTVLLQGCALVTEGSVEYLTVRTAPLGASCTVSRAGVYLGEIPATPGSLEVHRSSRDVNLFCTKPGWQPIAVNVEAQFTAVTFGNIAVGALAGPVNGIAGFIDDAATGANYSYDGQRQIILMSPLAQTGDPGSSSYAPSTSSEPAAPQVPASKASAQSMLAAR